MTVAQLTVDAVFRQFGRLALL
ncbi:MAG: hypothetical protein RLZZ598_740, partial [Pseudomonadota bacterium]